MAQETFSSLKPIQGETFSSVTPIQSTQSTGPDQPGFISRFLQSIGAPTSKAEAEALAPKTTKDALIQAAENATGILPAIAGYAKTALKGISEGKTDIDQAATNIA